MKSAVRKTLAAALAVVLLVGNFAAAASDALGHDLAARDAALNSGVTLAEGTFWSDSRSDLRQEFYVSYTPSERVTPVVTYGESSRALSTVTATARELEARGLRVVAGVNGDYYDTQYGLPIGSTMTEGALRNISSDPYYAVGFRADGTAVIGDPQLSLRTMINGGSGFPVYAFNYIRLSDYGVFLYDDGFNARHTTGTSESGVDVVCSVVEGALTIGGSLALRVEEVLPDAVDTPVPEGGYVLSANHKAADYANLLMELQPDDELILYVRSGAENAEDWNEVTNLLGAPVLLLEDGAVQSGLGTGSAPRTAIGQKADGTLIFYVIDGRKSGYSVGATLSAVGMRLAELGCVTAVALDGGGSSTVAATMPNETAARVVNTPSDGYERAVSNHVFLVASNEPSGRLDHIYLSASTDKALPGATVTLTAAAVDTNYIPMSDAVTLRADHGNLDGTALTLPRELGAVTVTANCRGKRAETVIEAVEPDSIVVRRGSSSVTSLTVSPNSEVALTARGCLNHLALAGDSDCFTWTYEGDGAALTGAHTLRVGASAGTGTLTVSLGSKSVSIPVTVKTTPNRLLDRFEAAFEPLVSEDGGTTLSHETSAARVHNGRGSARLDYAVAEPVGDETDAASVVPVSYKLPSGYETWAVWVYAEQPCAFELLFDNGARSGAVEYRQDGGWALLSGEIPSGAGAITGVVGAYAPDMETCTLWLDQLTLTNNDDYDDEAPVVTLTLDAEANTVSGRAFDASDGSTHTTLRLTYDGAALDFDYDRRTGAVEASLPEPDGFAHRVTLTAGDAMGNLARASVETSAADEPGAAFPDTEGHWANGYISYLRRAGVSKGSDVGLYHPEDKLTRQEFAVMLRRALNDGRDYSDVELPFADADQIADWALDAVRAMYALGVVNGSGDNEGRFWFKPTDGISRQEASAMVGRLLEKGWGAAELAFLDSDAIPDWAAAHIRTLVALGILNGYDDGKFHPADPLTRAQIAAVLYRMN